MWLLDFRTRDVGGPVATTPALYEGETLRGWGLGALPVPARGVTFVVHGYNEGRAVGRGDVEGFAAAAVAQVPSLAETLLVGVLWPGDARFGFVSYPTEEADADRTAEAFAAALGARDLPALPNFVAHSLGCRVALATLDRRARARPGVPVADQVILFAGAVDDDALARGDRYRRGVEGAARLVNVASTGDAVLRLAFPAGDWLAGLLAGGYTSRALGLRGPAAAPAAPAGVARLQVGHLGVGHGDYMGGGTELRRRASRFAGRALERIEPLAY